MMNARSPDKWRDPLLRGEMLRWWAHGTAETIAISRLLDNRTADTVTELVHEIHDGAQCAMNASPEIADRECRAGCSGCCHSLVSITAPEACAIATWLRDNKSPSEVDSLCERIEDGIDNSANRSDSEHATTPACALLDVNHLCSIYPVRPLGCRAWNSMSVDACHDCYLAGNIEKAIPQDQHAYEVGRGVRSGLAAGIRGAGLDGNRYELNSALSVALKTPDAAERWVHGDDVFEKCRRT